jgi:DNA-binding NarL/FixJ family response regulator
MTSVFVVDDAPWFLAAAAAVVSATPGFELIGQARSASETADRLLGAGATSPDLILMDVNLGDGSGIDLTSRLLTARPDLRVLLVSSLSEDELPVVAGSCGALGFVTKIDLAPEVLIRFAPTG